MSFEAGTLWPTLLEREARALERGTLQPIATAAEIVPDGGVDFVVRVAANVARKRASADRDARTARNPFLPYDPGTFVADVSPTHVALLNKYNVVDHHLLIVTRELRDQQSVLELDDLTALWACMREIDGLGFYNGGADAGASQPHRHLQLVPLPLSPGGAGIPMDGLLDAAPDQPIARAPGLSFAHVIVRIDDCAADDVASAAPRLLDHYLTALTALGATAPQPGASQPFAYNLLITRHRMLVVRRTRERAGGISINALGFAGSLFVRDGAQLERIRSRGPMGLLREVAA